MGPHAGRTRRHWLEVVKVVTTATVSFLRASSSGASHDYKNTTQDEKTPMLLLERVTISRLIEVFHAIHMFRSHLTSLDYLSRCYMSMIVDGPAVVASRGFIYHLT